MKKTTSLISLAASLMTAILGCATTGDHEIERKLIEEFCEKGKTVLYEVEGHREVYKIDPTFKKSENGCPIAVIRAWRDGRLTEEKEVEVCDVQCRR